MEPNGVLGAVFDQANSRLRTTGGGTAGTRQPSDENGVWSAVYDATTQALKVVVV